MHVYLSRRCLAVLIWGIAVVGTWRANAQPVEQLAPLTDLKANRNAGLIEKFRFGQEIAYANNKEHEKALDAEAKWLVYRFTCPQFGKSEFPKYQKEIKDFAESVEKTEHRKGNRAFVQQFGPPLAKAYRVLFDTDFQTYRQPIVNAAPTLVSAAHMKEDHFGLFLAEMVSAKNKHDVIKLYAAKALREYFPVDPTETNAILTAAQKRRKERELPMIDALTKFIERPAPANMSDEERDAFHYLRREAVESLAGAQAPTVVFEKGKVEAPIAPLLLRILSPKSGLDPAPRLAERIEAAIGVCQLKYSEVPDYQPEMGPFLVGLLLHELFTEYNKDLAEIGVDTTRPARMLWSVHAKRLELALKDMVTRAKGQPIEANVKQLEATAAPVLKSMQGPAKNRQRIDQGGLITFRNMVMNFRPKSNDVFKGVKGHSITLEIAPAP
jgi:hypothetical protein